MEGCKTTTPSLFFFLFFVSGVFGERGVLFFVTGFFWGGGCFFMEGGEFGGIYCQNK